ncbi:DNA polymerase III subunit alpha [Bacillus sp. 2205SS5-2]|uniref:DNA polymerase III subunit alpha n=1 Tax=Bacillus sp. 2205SS5-2 TaxID=3109031 RepID=UPI003003B6A9
MSFVHLQVSSAYSLLTSTIDIHTLVSKTKEKKFTAVALTDRNVMYGAVTFYQECIKQGIKPIIGMTADVKLTEEEPAFPLVLLAKSMEGYQNLLKISSVIGTKSKEGISARWLKAYGRGLFALSPGLEGKIESLLLSEKKKEAEETVVRYKQLFDQNSFFLTLQRHSLSEEDTVTPWIKQLAEETDTPLAITNNVFYLEQSDSFAQECLLAIRDGVKLSEENRTTLLSEEYYLKTKEQMIELFSEEVDALENTISIARACHVTMEFQQTLLPKYPLPGDVNRAEELQRLCREGLHQRIKDVTTNYIERLNYELNIIEKMGFLDYFLIVWDFMKYARDQNILTGPGRGSAAGSLVAYSLFITDVDPIEHDLLFERFLNPDRVTMPDIDIDFPDHRRDEVIAYVVHKYGERHVAQIITFGTFGAKAALRDTARVFGLNSKELDGLSRLVPTKIGISLKESIQESSGLKQFGRESPHHRRLLETALHIEGLPRHTSTHAAGVIISDQSLVNWVPLQQGSQEAYLTQYPMDILENIGLLKMDFLGLRNLSLLERILETVNRLSQKKISLQDIPLGDPKTFSLLSRGETTGIFQLESEGMRKVLKELKPNSFEDIVAVNALFRPGPMENIPTYVGRKHGKEPVHYPHQDLEPILERTYGVIVYQEQIMQIASKLAGFSLGEADLLRRAVSKKKKDVLAQERQHFVAGSLNKGYDKKVAESVYDLIVKFANYGFNRSHAVAYSMISYQLAYLKANYSTFFMSSLLTSAIGNEEKISSYAQEVRQMGIEILPPSINNSHFFFKVEKNKIRFSLGAIKGIGKTALQQILQARKEKPFQDLFDFCLRTSGKAVNRKILEALVFSGALDEFGEDRATLLATLDVALDHVELVSPKESEFALYDEEEALMLKPKYVEVDAMTIEDKLTFENQATGLFLSAHPVSIYDQLALSLQTESLFHAPISKKQIGVIVYLAEAKTIRTKKGDVMAFIGISDKTAIMEGVVFPDAYRTYGHLLKEGISLFLKGHVDQRHDKKQFIVQTVTNMEEATALVQHQQKLFIRIPSTLDEKSVAEELQSVLLKFKGNTPVVIYYEKEERTVQLSKQNFVKLLPSLSDELIGMIGKDNIVIK